MDITPAPARLTLHHEQHARRQRAKSLSHRAPAVVLLLSALDALTGREPLGWVTMVEFGVGAAYVGLLVREWRHLRRHPHHTERVAWLEIAAAGILALEGYHLWHRHHEAELRTGAPGLHVLPYLYAALAVVYLGLAFFQHRLMRRRHLHLHAGGFSGRLKPFGRAFHFRWEEVAAVEPAGAADLLVYPVSGPPRRLSFAALHEGTAHRDQLVAHFAAVRQEE